MDGGTLGSVLKMVDDAVHDPVCELPHLRDGHTQCVGLVWLFSVFFHDAPK